MSDDNVQEAPDLQPPDGVLVTRLIDADGSISFDVVVLGDVKATEAQTLLEMGIIRWREKIGLPAR